MEKEIWKDIVGYEGKYQVSNKGRVKSLERKRNCRVQNGVLAEMKIPERILKQWKRSSYLLVDLWKCSKRDVRSVHILVYEGFVGKIEEGMMIHHKDENKFNNNADNLEMVSYKTHNKIHHGGKNPWNKGIKMPPEVYKKMWETRRKNMLKANIGGSEVQIPDCERQPVECWTRQCDGLF